MTAELHSLRIFTVPGAAGVCGEARLIDPELGTIDTEFGPLLRWDKTMTVSADGHTELLEKLGDGITEVLCREPAPYYCDTHKQQFLSECWLCREGI